MTDIRQFRHFDLCPFNHSHTHRAGSQQFTIRANSSWVDGRGMALEHSQALSTHCVPEPDRLIMWAGEALTTIVREPDRPDGVSVSYSGMRGFLPKASHKESTIEQETKMSISRRLYPLKSWCTCHDVHIMSTYICMWSEWCLWSRFYETVNSIIIGPF